MGEHRGAANIETAFLSTMHFGLCVIHKEKA